MNNLDKAKLKYNSIQTPKELDQMINKIIEEDNKNRSAKKKIRALACTAATITILTIPLNLSPAFAQSMSEIPLIGAFARVLTISNYIKQDENILINANIPAVTNLNDLDYEEKINTIISEKVDNSIEEAKLRVDEYKEAFIETGGTEEEFKEKNMQVKIDYKIFSDTDNVLSFLVFSNDSVAAAYAEYSYYNIDVNSNKDLTLESLLGNNFQSIISESVKKDMKNQTKMAEIEFFDDVDIDNFIVRKDIDFYINSDNQIVVVFNKYEITSGAFGRIEYVINK